VTSSAAQRTPSLWIALLPVAALVVFLFVQIRFFDGSPHVPLILGTLVAAVAGAALGHPWRELEEGIIEGIGVGMRAILILLVIGMLIGTWIASGIVPVLIDYGLRLLSPGFFLLAACAVCAVVSVATGSSWTTAGTIGVALIGVGEGLGVPAAMSAGAIISGAYFGDKMSPLSDSTNLAPAVAGSELFEHIRYMMYTTLPALGVALVLFAFLGTETDAGGVDTGQIAAIRSALASRFVLSPVLLLAPLGVIAVVALRMPALPALMGGVLLGAVLAMAIQGASLQQVMEVAQSGYVATTGSELVDELLTRGGLESMMSTVALVFCALSFGGVMERTGFLRALAGAIVRLAHTTGSLVLATVASCIGTNIIAPDQYLSIIVPGRMYRESFEEQGLEPKLLSRTLEDAGTLSSPLVPWNTCGAFMSAALTVPTAAYLPYAFLNLLTPVIAVIIAFSGYGIVRRPAPAPSGTPVGSRLDS